MVTISEVKVADHSTTRRALLRPDGVVALALFLTTALVFWLSPIANVGDSKYSMLLSHQLLTRHSFVLDDYGIPREPLLRYPDVVINGKFYQLEVVNGHLYYYFPPGTSVLSAPFVGVMELLGVRLVKADGSYDLEGEEEMQRLLAAMLLAALAALFYFSSRLLLPVGWSVVLALGGALGTQVWSTASRGLWTHTWGSLLLGGALYLLLARETNRDRRARPVLLASVLAWTYFVRPTNSIFIVGITIYLLLRHREGFIAYATTGALWFVGFVTYSWSTFGTLLPSYFRADRLEVVEFWPGLAGDLFSPSRGLLTNVPVLFWIVWLLARYWRNVAFPSLVWLTLTMCAGHFAVIASFTPWYGGICFGPRYTTELVPWIFLLAVLGVSALRQSRVDHDSWPWHVTLACGSFLTLVGVFIHGRGATSRSTALWNISPVSIHQAPSRLWDWRYPQFLAGLIPPPPPTEFPLLPPGRLEFGIGGPTAFRYAGWSENEADFCWTEAHQATLAFALADPAQFVRLRLKFNPFPHRKRKTQTVRITLNGQSITSFQVTAPEPQEYVIVLPAGVLHDRNVLTFNLPDAASPSSQKLGDDPRLLGIAVYWLELEMANGKTGESE